MLLAKNVEVSLSLPSSCEIEFTCHFDHRAELLFDTWTDPEHVKQWWGCDGSEITTCEIDLRVGGSWKLVMQMPDASKHPFFGTYKEIVRPSRLVYSECYNMPQFGSPEWQTTVTFEPAGSGTVLTHTIRHKSQEARDGHLKAGMQAGEIQSLSKINALLNQTQHTTTPPVR